MLTFSPLTFTSSQNNILGTKKVSGDVEKPWALLGAFQSKPKIGAHIQKLFKGCPF